MLTPAIYRTTITHNRQAPVHHVFEYRSYSWYVDLDDLPSLPWWLRPFARFDARDHFVARPARSRSTSLELLQGARSTPPRRVRRMVVREPPLLL